MALTKITNDLLDLGLDTGALGLPKGTTAQRPSNPVEGTLRHNSEIDETKLETFDGNDWRKINKVIPSYTVDYLVVSGGGGGGNDLGSGGGSSLIYRQGFQLTPLIVYNVSVGGGGAYHTDGNPSSFNSSNSTAGDAGSTLRNGFGGDGQKIVNGVTTNFTGGANGGGASAPNEWRFGGGGAGTNGNGTTGFSNPGSDNGTGGDGGNGLQVDITGSLVYYGGGGAGGARISSGIPGLGGGGIGGEGPGTPNGGNGTPNTGGGGGGAGGEVNVISGLGGNGGSGVVILRMPTADYSGTTTGSPTVTTDGTDTILTYTSSGTYTA